MDNKLSELNKPRAFVVTGGKMYQDRAFTDKSTAERSKADRHDGAVVEPLYSQEYVSALLAELEAKNKCIAEAEVRGVEKLAAAFKSWASDETFPDYEAQRHWATASQEALSFADDLRNGSCDDR
ncbi:Uncharacterised protein [Serratia marcescens]|nr:Uncharacterised protein [Serratia marcescens]